MGRKKKVSVKPEVAEENIKIEEVIEEKVEEVVVVKPKPQPKLISLRKALYKYKHLNPRKSTLMEEEVMEVFAKKRVPSLMTTMEEWKKIFEEF